jgi:hypothetical protein
MHVTLTLRWKRRGPEVCLEVKIDLWRLALLAWALAAVLR